MTLIESVYGIFKRGRTLTGQSVGMRKCEFDYIDVCIARDGVGNCRTSGGCLWHFEKIKTNDGIEELYQSTKGGE